MPFTRITLRQGYSEAALHQISTLASAGAGRGI